MKKIFMTTLIVLSMLLSGCQSFQKDRDLEMYVVGALLSFDENCGIGAAAAFVLWY
jgi:hypothetical protein